MDEQKWFPVIEPLGEETVNIIEIATKHLEYYIHFIEKQWQGLRGLNPVLERFYCVLLNQIVCDREIICKRKSQMMWQTSFLTYFKKVPSVSTMLVNQQPSSLSETFHQQMVIPPFRSSGYIVSHRLPGWLKLQGMVGRWLHLGCSRKCWHPGPRDCEPFCFSVSGILPLLFEKQFQPPSPSTLDCFAQLQWIKPVPGGLGRLCRQSETPNFSTPDSRWCNEYSVNLLRVPDSGHQASWDLGRQLATSSFPFPVSHAFVQELLGNDAALKTSAPRFPPLQP
ncbi:LOW QUALITY PROTEIN: hypothetical protein QTO34_009671 [Cnephaeus nilssonii]|uniref:Uncharacterized protein n=1 Tax=Cnephaeus nilssonii TaxID=3371016 RepID=A0AA40HI78_CNENI|nr:LOW QUALITY PROTEIN: hypothetical protein QTO34_009671 [Eptesicus nilssonii]